MADKESLGIQQLEAIHYYVHDIERSRRFYTELMGFAELGRSGDALEKQGNQTSRLFAANDCRVLVSAPLNERSRAARFLRKHPDGVGTLIFRVEDIERTFKLLDERGGTPIDEIHHCEDGSMSFFSITTPFGDTTFRFVQRKKDGPFLPGFEHYETPRGGDNPYRFSHIDHITSNFQTMSPALLWMEHVLGFERYWKVEFHTRDVAQDEGHTGSGLRSVVMWDPKSGVKFANNEPMRPFFKNSQINLFNEDHRGDGVQHAALAVEDIVPCVRGLRAAGVQFMPTPGAYYDALPERIQSSGIGHIDEDVSLLRELEILIDGEADHAYLLQIFLADSASMYKEPESGAFFFEIIQRKGDDGFGAGNFRALFESIERQQIAERAL
ncbi:4-hydroxyphenylpyruvate dioxygenase family protein [Haliangium ochraceum]|uniref:4-hydroxyphenylpyruvate dioxygenase n=1 Tax=Haliangium ochraceum (strain DSM 14365 / JCM 11303 / SMP-2) TaxID=502025 RepID=D0LRM9_HALO1|nr:VOC family protein [Haliangium ochraceum]ACY19021.1 4-hydroxyphenylpyruvate dioxygenase [Haliangium ochraceum DSM 14365]